MRAPIGVERKGLLDCEALQRAPMTRTSAPCAPMCARNFMQWLAALALGLRLHPIHAEHYQAQLTNFANSTPLKCRVNPKTLRPQ